MAKKIAPRVYEVSPTESLWVTVTGPDKPTTSFDGTTLDVKEGIAFELTPELLGTDGDDHDLEFVLLFPADDTPSPGYTIIVEDKNGALETVRKTTPTLEHTATVELTIRVSKSS